MAEKYLFFNSTLEDRRKHKASDIAEYWDSFLSSGLIHVNGSPTLKVSANSTDMEVNIDLGKVVILGHLYINDSPLKKLISQSTASEDRFDRVVLRLDLSIENRYIKAFIKEGTALAPPELIREGNIYEVSLAQIHVKAGKSYLEQADIIDERLDESLCGLASSLVTVPTDIFTKEWEEFVYEYNRWFTEIQSATYATVEDVRKSENNIKREIANLNLQLEATKRVKNGVTFGTNFADNFGMEIDMARTSSDDALVMGQTEIIVQDASEFMAGTEVTIYDDINLERLMINSVVENVVTLKSGLINDYKEEVNIARSMAVSDNLVGNMRFGAWGTYKHLNLHKEDLPAKYLNAQNSSTKFAFFQGLWVMAGRDGLHVYDNLGDVSLISYSDYVDDVNPNYVRVNLESNDKYLVLNIVATSGKGLNIIILDRQMSEISRVIWTKSFTATCMPTNNKLSVLTGRDIYLYSLSPKGVLTLEGEGVLSATTSLSTLHLPCIYDEVDNSYNILLTSDRGELIYNKLDSNYSLIETKTILNVGTTYQVADASINKVAGEYVVATIHKTNRDIFNILKSNNGSAWTSITFDSNLGDLGTASTHSRLLILDDGRIFLFSGYKTGGIFLYDEGLQAFERVESYITGGNTLVSIWYNTGANIEIPFVMFSWQSIPTIITGSGYIGYGADITTNDIRFKTKPSKELVTWLQHDEGLTVDEVKTGNVYAELSTVGSETQAVGVSTQEFDETRITISRASVDDDVKITRILGGVE